MSRLKEAMGKVPTGKLYKMSATVSQAAVPLTDNNCWFHKNSENGKHFPTQLGFLLPISPLTMCFLVKISKILFIRKI